MAKRALRKFVRSSLMHKIAININVYKLLNIEKKMYMFVDL